jgi:hypothetical protein
MIEGRKGWRNEKVAKATPHQGALYTMIEITSAATKMTIEREINTWWRYIKIGICILNMKSSYNM